MTMRQAVRRTLFPSLAASALLLAASAPAQAGDWGLRFSGDMGWAPESAAERFFDASEKDFKYRTNGIELGVAYKEWDLSAFMYTAGEGRLTLDYALNNCGNWGQAGERICLGTGVTLPEGTFIDPQGMRMFGLKGGRFFTLWRPSKLLRVGVPVHVGVVLDGGEAVRNEYRVSLQPAQGGFGLVSRPTSTKIPGSEIFKGGLKPYPIVDIGIGFKFRSANWAEIEVFLKADNPRFPILAWGMTFRRQRN